MAKNVKTAYDMLGHACQYLIRANMPKNHKGPVPFNLQAAFIILWQAQCAIVKEQPFFHPVTSDFNEQTSGHSIDEIPCLRSRYLGAE